MAFLVCYSQKPPDDHPSQVAIYLDQSFYEMIFSHFRSAESRYSIMRDIALLRYKSPTLVVPNTSLQSLNKELACLAKDGLKHSQISGFQTVVLNALNSESSLTISGDMYPVL